MAQVWFAFLIFCLRVAAGMPDYPVSELEDTLNDVALEGIATPYQAFQPNHNTPAAIFKCSWDIASCFTSLKSQMVDLHVAFVRSIWMNRYAMLVAWICFWHTALQFTSACLHLQVDTILNLVCNTSFFFMYASFLYLFAWMGLRPTCTYML